MTMREKVDLSMGYLNPVRKLGVAGRFLRDNQTTVILKSGNFIISEKMPGYPQFSFWISRAFAKFSFLCIVLNGAKYL